MREIELQELLDTAKKFNDYNYNKYVTVDWNGVPLVIRKMLEPKQVTLMFKNIMSAIRINNSLVPELFDFTFRLFFVTEYSLVEMPDDVDTQYKILYGTDLFDIVKKNVNKAQYNSIINSFNILFGAKIKL